MVYEFPNMLSSSDVNELLNGKVGKDEITKLIDFGDVIIRPLNIRTRS